MNKNLKIFLLVAIFVFVAIFILFRAQEDTWICSSGQWVKHGVPSTPMPQGQCTWSDNLNPFR